MKWKKSLSNRGSHETQVKCRMLKKSAVCYSVFCSVLQCVAVRCSVVQCIAASSVCCSVLHIVFQQQRLSRGACHKISDLTNIELVHTTIFKKCMSHGKIKC